MARTLPEVSRSQLKAFLAPHSAWKKARGQLQRTFELDTFPQAIAFVRAVAQLAEKAQHHPDIDIRSQKVIVRLVTHDAGGVTALDTELAARLEQAFTRTRRGAEARKSR